MNKYYEVVPITDKPEKDCAVILIDKNNLPDGGEFREGKFYVWNPVASEFLPVNDKYGYRWLREVSSLPIDKDTARKIASEAWDAALDEGDSNNPSKGEYLKQFE